VQDRGGERLDRDVADEHPDDEHARTERAPAKAVLEHQRQKEGGGTDRHPEEGAAEIRGPERRDAEHAQVEQRVGGPPEVDDGPPDQYRPYADTSSDSGPRDAAVGDELEPVDEGTQPGAGQREPPPVKACCPVWPQIGHDAHGDKKGDEAQREIENEDPAP